MINLTLFVTLWVFIDDIDRMIKLNNEGWRVESDMSTLAQNWAEITSTKVSKHFDLKLMEMPDEKKLREYIDAFNHLTTGHVEYGMATIDNVPVWDISYLPEHDAYEIKNVEDTYNDK